MKRTQLKKGISSLKKTPLRKSNPITAKQKHNDRIEQKEKDIIFYNEIWSERSHKCEITGQYLGSEMKTIFFHHLLPKEFYPKFRHEKWNIIQLQDFIHNQIEINPFILTEEEYDIYSNHLNIAKKNAGI